MSRPIRPRSQMELLPPIETNYSILQKGQKGRTAQGLLWLLMMM